VSGVFSESRHRVLPLDSSIKHRPTTFRPEQRRSACKQARSSNSDNHAEGQHSSSAQVLWVLCLQAAA
jgi:hypothetical protein